MDIAIAFLALFQIDGHKPFPLQPAPKHQEEEEIPPVVLLTPETDPPSPSSPRVR